MCVSVVIDEDQNLLSPQILKSDGSGDDLLGQSLRGKIYCSTGLTDLVQGGMCLQPVPSWLLSSPELC